MIFRKILRRILYYTFNYPTYDRLSQKIGCHEPDNSYMIRRLLDSKMIFVDVGAGYGHYTKIAEKVGCEVHAFEPDKRRFADLQKRFRKSDRVTLHNIALSDGNDKNGIDNLFVGDVQYFIKIDVRGRENLVIAGAENTLKKRQAIVFCVFYSDEAFDVVDFNMRKFGYKPYWLIKKDIVPAMLGFFMRKALYFRLGV